MKRLLALTVALLSSACLLGLGVACGGDDDDDDSSSSSYTCCVNGAFYVCPSSDAMQQCESACTRTASRDNECNM
jgi:hypothetical protein